MASIFSLVRRSYLAFSVFSISIWLLAPCVQAIVSSTYQLDTDYSGASFFDGFDFWTDSDPTNGFVSYQSQASSSAKGLISTSSNGSSYMGVDHTTTLQTNGAGRESVRISSKKTFTHGLFIADIAHMPGTICGAWPAFWMFGPNWPNSGEIDIIEGVNSQKNNVMTLHSGGECTISGALSLGTLQSSNCNQNEGYGCSISSSTSSSYGDGFNSASGGVYATQWTSDYIRIWFFPRAAIPSNILSGTPDPSSWGLPEANFQGNCDVDTHFQDHQIVFDTTFCGDWAGNVWSTDSECSVKASSCVDFVAGSPEAFEDAYWNINYVKVYTLGTAPVATSTELASSSKSTSIPITSKTSSSTTAKTTHSLTSPVSSIVSQIPPQPTSDHTTSSFPPFPTSSNSTHSSNPAALPNWTYIGCLSSPTTGFPTFTLASENENMTVSICASSCSSWSYLGTYNTFCYCGSTVEDTIELDNKFCSAPCPGNPSESCGGLLNLKSKKDKLHMGHIGKRLEKRINEGYLLTVYANEALLPDSPTSSLSEVLDPTADPSEAHFVPSTGGIPTPSTSRMPVSTLIGIGMGGSAEPASTSVDLDPDTGVHFVPTNTPLPTPTTSVKPASSLQGIGMGGGIFASVSTTEKYEVYTTVLTTTYTDICGCAESTLKEFTVTSTMTITHCGCHKTSAAGPAFTSTKVQIPMTTYTRICSDCGINGMVVVTVPCEEAATTHEHLSLSSAHALATVAPSPPPKETGKWGNATTINTQGKIETVTILPQPIPGPAENASASLTAAANGTVLSNSAENRRMEGSRWGVSAVFGGLAVLIWMFG